MDVSHETNSVYFVTKTFQNGKIFSEFHSHDSKKYDQNYSNSLKISLNIKRRTSRTAVEPILCLTHIQEEQLFIQLPSSNRQKSHLRTQNYLNKHLPNLLTHSL